MKINIDDDGFRQDINGMLATLRTAGDHINQETGKIEGSIASKKAAMAALVAAGVEGITEDELVWKEIKSPSYKSTSKEMAEGLEA